MKKESLEKRISKRNVRKSLAIFVTAVTLATNIIGCTGTQKGAGIGTLVGASAGAIIGYQSGHAAEGALVGGAIGAATGGLIGDNLEKKYCPYCGGSYNKDIYYCPRDRTELLYKE